MIRIKPDKRGRKFSWSLNNPDGLTVCSGREMDEGHAEAAGRWARTNLRRSSESEAYGRKVILL